MSVLERLARTVGFTLLVASVICSSSRERERLGLKLWAAGLLLTLLPPAVSLLR